MNRITRIKDELNDLFKNNLDDNQIFYDLDNDNIDILKVMMIGTKDTPYENGFFFFTIRYPDNYPDAPMIVWYYTTNSKMRFNPNLYNNGKICLSIINTWGSQFNWTSEMNTRSVLLSIQSMVLNEFPLNNEPGLKLTEKTVTDYNNVLYYCVFNISILQNLNQEKTSYLENRGTNVVISFSCFKEHINTYFENNIDWYINRCKELHFKFKNVTVFFTSPYERASYTCNYLHVLEQFIKIYSTNTGKKLSDIFISLDQVNLNKFTIPKLKTLCKKNKIKDYSRKNKEQIITLILSKNENIII
jgi:ubiquitin-protein ligase